MNGLSNAALSGVETISAATATSDVKINLNAQSEAFTIIGGSGNDILVGGTANDTLTGNGGADQFRLRTNGGTETITDFTPGTDKIGFLEGSGGLPAVDFATAGTAAGATLTAGDGNFTTRGSIAGINSTDDNQVDVITATQTTAQITADINVTASNLYVVVFNSTTGKAEIWFDDNWDNPGSRVQVATLDGVTAAQVAALAASDFVVYNNVADPLILDLGAPGIDLTEPRRRRRLRHQRRRCRRPDGLDGGRGRHPGARRRRHGTIDNGTEIFSPWFAGGSTPAAWRRSPRSTATATG